MYILRFDSCITFRDGEVFTFKFNSGLKNLLDRFNKLYYAIYAGRKNAIMQRYICRAL